MKASIVSIRLLSLIVLFAATISIMIQPVQSIGLIPAIKQYDYQGPFTDKIDYVASWNSNRPGVLGADLDGELAKYATLDIVEGQQLKKGEAGGFSVTLDVPENHGLIGKQVLWVRAYEVPPEASSGLFVITTAVRGAIVVNFPYPGKYLEISQFELSDIPEGGNSVLSWKVRSRGDETVGYTAKMVIYNADDSVFLQKDYSLKTIQPDELQEIVEVVQTSKLKPGKYKAELFVEYVGESKSAETQLRVGEEDLELTDYSPKEVVKGEISEFTLTVESLWSGVFENVYADISVQSVTARTPSTYLEGFESKQLKQFVDLRSLDIGQYEGVVKVVFDGNERQFPIQINITEPVIEDLVEVKESSGSGAVFWIIICVLIVLIIAGLIIIIRRKNAANQNQGRRQ